MNDDDDDSKEKGNQSGTSHETMSLLEQNDIDGKIDDMDDDLHSDRQNDTDIDMNQSSNNNSKLRARPFESRSKRTFFETNAGRRGRRSPDVFSISQCAKLIILSL